MTPQEQIVKKMHPHYMGFLRFYFFGILFIIFGVFFILFLPANIMVGAIIILISIFVFLMGEISRRAETFYVLESGVAREYKLLSTSRKFVEFEKIQNMEVNQSFGQKIYGIGDIHFDTAGTDKVEVSFPNINNPYEIEKIIREKMAEN
ncbi:MAG: PH domain-containing protein [Patescibacteria group bacterium]